MDSKVYLNKPKNISSSVEAREFALLEVTSKLCGSSNVEWLGDVADLSEGSLRATFEVEEATLGPVFSFFLLIKAMIYYIITL